MEDNTAHTKQKRNSSQRFKLPSKIIKQYQELPIFKAISSKEIKPTDIIKLHQLARNLKKQHPNLSIETILQNQIELYLTIQAELKKYFKSDKSNEAFKKMKDAIDAKSLELTKSPLINKLYETNFEKYAKKGGDKAWINFIAASLHQSIHNQFSFDETQHWNDFIDSAEQLSSILENQDRKEETNEAGTPGNNISVSQEVSYDKPVEHQDTEPTPLQPEAKEEPKPENNVTPQVTSPKVVEDKPQDDEKKDTDKSKHESVNDDFKTSWREFADNVATKLKGKVIEEQEAKDFVAKVEHAEGQVSIRASSLNEISIGAKDKENKETTPDMVVFKELVEKSAREGRGINFGNIRDNEFKARLLIVCIEKNVSTKGEPKITDEFLKSLDEKTAKQLIILQNKAQMENSDVQRRISDAKSRIKSAESPGETSNSVAETGDTGLKPAKQSAGSGNVATVLDR